MIKINENAIEYTKGDTFELSVDSDSGFEEGSTLRVIIAENETSDPNIDNVYSLTSDGIFIVAFSEEDKRRLNIKPYLYKLILINAEGKSITRISGHFIVKWGA